METIIGLIVFVFWWFIFCKVPDIKFDNYTPPKGQGIDYLQQSNDICKGVSANEIKRRTVNGYYNKPVDKYGCINRNKK